MANTNQSTTPAPEFSVGSGGMGSGTGNKKRLILIGLALLILIAIGVAAGLLWHKDNSGYSDKKNSDSSSAGADLPSGQINITDSGLTPSTLKIKVGQSVTWVNMSNQAHRVTEDPYTATTAPHGLDSQEPLANGESYTYTFDEAGTYTYHDHLNPTDNNLHGTIEVTQ